MSINYVKITPQKVELNNCELPVTSCGVAMLSEIYRSQIKDYPKFFKMDTLSRLGFVASELLLAEETNRFTPCEDRAVIMINHSASFCDDSHYQSTIADAENYFPSPSVFVYTLPNIVTGEIAIRNKYYGETSFFVLPKYDEHSIADIVFDAFHDDETQSVLGGWLECINDENFEAVIFIINRDTDKSELINLLKKHN